MNTAFPVSLREAKRRGNLSRMILSKSFFNRDAQIVAKALLGKVLRVKYRRLWLSAQIIETEAYYLHEKGSHASLGFTEKRKALFMKPGTIYMYYARGGDSLNVSCQGGGNAVLIKSGIPYGDSEKMIQTMQMLNPCNGRLRAPEKLCSGQTLLCKSLHLKVPDWDQQQFDAEKFYIEDVGYQTKQIIQTTRLGIPEGRDEHLEFRFVDKKFLKYCTKMPVVVQ